MLDKNGYHMRMTNETAEPVEKTEKLSILEQTEHSLIRWFVDRDLPKYRAKQVLSAIYQRRIDNFCDMSELPKDLRTKLDEHFCIFGTKTAESQQSEDGTEKLLLELPDGGRIECVLLRDGPRRSVCLSSQVGCAMGCVFCASGLDGVDRNLSRGEILEQALKLQRLLEPEERLSHIVMMGMGEPLANLRNVLEALDVARDSDYGLGISPRRITISTVGLPPAIDKLAEAHSPFQLAISLHAPTDELRTRLVPVNKNIGIEAIMAATERYFAVTSRRLTFEYVLLKGLNDSPQCAEQLVKLLRRRTAMLNVIPYNPVPGLPYETPSSESILEFRRILMEGGINVMFRQRKGNDIQAACGQLRRLREREPQIVHLDSNAQL